MRILCILLILGCVWLPATASAEYYKYRDQNGMLRYTDNLADIPEDQRPKMETRSSTEDYFPTQEPAETEPEDKKVQEFNKKMEDQRQATGREMQSGSAGVNLQRIKNSLDREYSELMKEKEELLKSRGKVRTEADGKDYSERVTELNKKNADFEARRQAFQKEAEAFNEKTKSAAGEK
jgi:hypothetical protein